jgi:hypothetical protein
MANRLFCTRRTQGEISGRGGWAGFAALSLLFALGCGRPDSAAVARWKTTPEAATKLAAVVKDPKVDVQVRGEAAAALVEVNLGEEMEAAVAGLDIGERAVVIPAIAPRVATLLEAPDAEKAGDARDALYALREQATTADARKAIEGFLYPALLKDVRAGRARAGRYNVLDMLVGIGQPVVPLLIPLLEDPAVPFATMVEAIDKIGHGPSKEKAGDALVVRAGKMPSLPETIWPALATLGGKKAGDFLIATVERGAAPDVDRAAKAMEKISPRTPGVSAFAVKTAGAGTTPPGLREQMFVIAERNGGEDNRKALIALIGSTPDPAIRDRAFRAVVKAAGGPAILPALEAFPPRARLTATELREQIVAPLSSMPGMDTRGPMFKAMDSKSPLAKLVAVLVLEKMGFKSDAEPLEKKLAKDTSAVPGLPPDDRIDRAVARATATLKKSTY